MTPTPAPEWGHVCDKGIVKMLKGIEGLHMYHCTKKGRAYATHAAQMRRCYDSCETCSRRPNVAMDGW